MAAKPVSVSPEESILLASRLLFRYNIGSLPVCSADGTLRGVITDRDIVLRCVALGDSPASTSVSSAMSRCVYAVSPDDDVSRAVLLMSDAQVRRLPVAENGRLVGVVSLCDIARLRSLSAETASVLAGISCGIRGV